MNFNEWWESITEPERKMIGRTNAKYVWVCAQEAEREACARVAESYEPRCEVCPSGVSLAIRERGLTKLNKAAEDNGEPL